MGEARVVDDECRFSAVLRQEGPTLTVRVHGELDLVGAPLLEQRLSEHLDLINCERVVVDMSQVSFMDAAGVNALLKLRRRLDGEHALVTVADPPATVRKLLLMMRVVGPPERRLVSDARHDRRGVRHAVWYPVR